jgi:hypothetical protein
VPHDLTIMTMTRATAKAAGLKRYFTGKPCSRGHVCERRISTCQCISCVTPQKRDWAKANYCPEMARQRRLAESEQRARRIKAWRRENQDHVRSYKNDRRRTDPQIKLAEKLRIRLYKALHGQARNGSAVKLLGIPLKAAIAAIEAKFLPGMTWANHGLWHIDHRRPLSKFDLTNPEQLAEVCHISNLQPLWAIDNQRKGSR